MFDKCTGVAVMKNDCILLGLRTDGQGWCLAGGKMESNETAYACAKRELMEEFGLLALSLKYIGQVEAVAYVKGEQKNVKPHIYLCEDFWGEVRLKFDEMRDYQWVKLREAEKIKELFPPSREAIKLLQQKIST